MIHIIFRNINMNTGNKIYIGINLHLRHKKINDEKLIPIRVI